MVKLGHQASWHEPTIIAISSPGKRAYVPEICPFPDVTDKLPAEMKRKEPAGLPELSEAVVPLPSSNFHQPTRFESFGSSGP